MGSLIFFPAMLTLAPHEVNGNYKYTAVLKTFFYVLDFRHPLLKTSALLYFVRFFSKAYTPTVAIQIFRLVYICKPCSIF